MLVQLVLGAVMLVVSVMLHAVVLDRSTHYIRASLKPGVPRSTLWRLGALIAASLAAFASHVAQAWMWAVMYLSLGEFNTLEESLYFSVVIFTTLGLGDVHISPDWRLLASFESAVGFFIYGLSTAFVFEVMRTVWSGRPHS